MPRKGKGDNEPTKDFVLRLPAELHEQVLEEAGANLRSLNSEVIVLLREALQFRAEGVRPKENPLLATA